MRPLAIALLAALGCASAASPHQISAGRYAMGTVLELTLVGADEPALVRARDDALAEVERLEGLLSTWRPESDVSRLNGAAGRGALAVDPEQVRGGPVEKGDVAVGVEHDDPFAERLEDTLEEAALADEAGDQALHLTGFDAVEAGDHFLEETRVHAGSGLVFSRLGV